VGPLGGPTWGVATFVGGALSPPWLTPITLNHARNRIGHLASRRRHEAYSLDAPRRNSEGDRDETRREDPPSGAPSALELMETQALRKRVEKCIDALPTDFREVLVPRDLQDHS